MRWCLAVGVLFVLCMTRAMMLVAAVLGVHALAGAQMVGGVVSGGT